MIIFVMLIEFAVFLFIVLILFEKFTMEQMELALALALRQRR